jgi:hypothetical protein
MVNIERNIIKYVLDLGNVHDPSMTVSYLQPKRTDNWRSFILSFHCLRSYMDLVRI